MTESVRILTESVEKNIQFRSGSLVFQPQAAKAALELLESLSGENREWFEKQSPMRMIFMGEASKRGPLPPTREKKKEKEL